jgi:Tol biopolymer transport system component
VAVSPDGSYLAYAISRDLLGDAGSQPATITVVRIANGASRTWKLWPAGRTRISELSWAKDGQLSFVGVIGDATVANGAVVPHRGDEVSVVMIFSASAPAPGLVAASRLVTFGWSRQSQVGPSGVLDGPVAGVITSDGTTVVTQILTEHGKHSKLVEMSAANGQIIRVLLDGPRSFQADPASIDGNRLLFTLSPRREHPAADYVCGHLALDNLNTERIVQLPFEIYCSTVWPGSPFLAAW